ncbi:hypothetical protein ACLKA6_005765 [Drosophila palustris]
MLIMPSLMDHIFFGMDFLCAMGATVRCGNAELVLGTVGATAAEPAGPAGRAREPPKGVPPGGERRPPRRGRRRRDRRTPGSSRRAVRCPLVVDGGRIVATVEVDGKAMTATPDTGATRSFISEDCVRRWAIQGETQAVQTRIRLVDGSTLEVGGLLRVDVGMAGRVVNIPMLIMPSLMDHIFFGMDFLCAMGATVRCGNAELVLGTVGATAAEPAGPAGRAREQPKGVPPGGERRPPRRGRMRRDRRTPGSSRRAVRCPLVVDGGRIVATVEVDGKAMTATPDTGATRSFISEDCVRRWAIQGETQAVQTRIRLVDGSTLEVGGLLRVDVGMAGRVVNIPMLIMPSLMDHIFFGMDFLCAMGATGQPEEPESHQKESRRGEREGLHGVGGGGVTEGRQDPAVGRHLYGTERHRGQRRKQLSPHYAHQ